MILKQLLVGGLQQRRRIKMQSNTDVALEQHSEYLSSDEV
jgi:hypothetical protein